MKSAHDQGLHSSPADRHKPSAVIHSERETAQYIADMVLELRNMAKANDLKTLQGLLEVSFYEASGVANKIAVPEGEIEHLRQLSLAAGRLTP